MYAEVQHAVIEIAVRINQTNAMTAHDEAFDNAFEIIALSKAGTTHHLHVRRKLVRCDERRQLRFNRPSYPYAAGGSITILEALVFKAISCGFSVPASGRQRIVPGLFSHYSSSKMS